MFGGGTHGYGYRQAPPAHGGQPRSGPTAQVCSACGFGAPTSAQRCSSCARDLATRRRIPPGTGDLVWCAVRATFQCRSCAFHSPLEGIELDQGVHCAQCGAFQKFDPSGWEAMLAQAHAVADLAGPAPEGSFPNPRIWIGASNPHRRVGLDEDSAKAGGGQGAGGGALPEVELARGWPTCGTCEELVEVALEPSGCRTTCRRCSATATYALPPTVGGWAEQLRGIVAAEQRTDQRCVKMTTQVGGPVALSCPGCGAPIGAVRMGSVRCGHCNATAFVPARAQPRDDGTLVSAVPFFLVFQGPSAERRRLETPAVDADTKGKALVSKFMSRGLDPLPGIELAPVKQGIDFRQLFTTLGLAAFALAIGLVVLIVFLQL